MHPNTSGLEALVALLLLAHNTFCKASVWPQGIGELPTQVTKRIPKPLDPNIFDLFAFRTPEPEYIWVFCIADWFTERYLRI